MIVLKHKSTVLMLFFGIAAFFVSCAQTDNTSDGHLQNQGGRNIVIVTLDGVRWQEVFRGADAALLFKPAYYSEDSTLLSDRYMAPTAKERRKKLMPFFWETIAKKGKLFGNRDLGNKFNVANPYVLSYPGYSEIFTGFPDEDIDSNKYGINPNTNVLEYLNDQAGYKNEVLGFCGWVAFDRILDLERNHMEIYTGKALKDAYEQADPTIMGQVTEQMYSLPFHLFEDSKMLGDIKIYALAKTYLAQEHPKIAYIALSKTDHFAHQRTYDFYLDEIYNSSVILGDLWQFLQEDEFYKDNTTLIITTDHGRGKKSWYSHGGNPRASQTWVAVIGPDTEPLGEIDEHRQFYNEQLAQTIAHFLGLNFTADHPIAQPIGEMMDK